MATPEAAVKARIKAIFKARGIPYHMPVPGGFGESWLDFISAHPVTSHILHVETKAPGNKPTPRQEGTIRRLRAARHKVFVIDGTDPPRPGFDTYADLETWLDS